MAILNVPIKRVWRQSPGNSNFGDAGLNQGIFYVGRGVNNSGEHRGFAEIDPSNVPQNVFVVEALLDIYVYPPSYNQFVSAYAIVTPGAYESVDYVKIGNIIRNDLMKVNGPYPNQLVESTEYTYQDPEMEDFFDVTRLVRIASEGTDLAGFRFTARTPSTVQEITAGIEPLNLKITYDKGLTSITPNGGETLSGVTTVSWVHDTEYSNLTYEIEISLDNGATWQYVATSAVNARSHNVDFSALQETSLGLMRVRAVYPNGKGPWLESDGVFSTTKELAPLAPTNLTPHNTVINRETMNWFSWRHNDPNPNDTQSRADVRWRVQGSTTWDEKVINGGDNQSFYPPNTFPVGVIEWQVRTHDQQSLVSPWSSLAVFTSSPQTDAPTIVLPGANVAVSRPTVQWSSGQQLAYQVVFMDGQGATVWDTGEVSSTNKAITVGTDLVNGAKYTVKVRVKAPTGLWSDYATKAIQVSYTPPARAVVSTELTDTGIRLIINNPTPTGTQPYVTHNDIYKQINGKWTRIAKYIHDEYIDNAASGKLTEYRVRAYGQNDTQSESDVISATLILKHPTFNSALNPDVEIVLKHMTATSKGKNRGRALSSFAGRTHQMAEFGTLEIIGYSFSWISFDRDEVEAFYDFFDRKETFLYRDAEGRKSYITVDVTDEVEGIGGQLMFTLSFVGDVVWFKEEV